jgi:tetratricopeptide (TPR) repeat protein
MLEKYDEAIKCYDKALELTPQYVDAMKGKELCLSSMISAS